MKNYTKLLCTLIAGLSLAGFATGDQFDMVIQNGRVMDPETNYDNVANVGIKDGRIVVITEKEIKGKETIDAKGLVVSPGFIDTHFHWTRPIGYKFALRDGVTTAMDLEAGTYGPRVAEWYAMHEGRSAVNYGTGSGHEFARNKVTEGLPDSDLLDAPFSVVKGRGAGTKWSDEVLNLEKGNGMLSLIDEGLRQGAISVASTVGYLPGASAREMFEVQRVGANYGRPTSVHLRYTPGTDTTEVNGAQEVLANAIALGAGVSINHFNNPGWPLVQELLVRLRKKGHNVWGEIYPYAAGQTTINAAFVRPENWVEKLGHKYEETMQDPLSGEFYTLDKYQKILAEAPTTQVVLYKMPPDDIAKWCALPGVVYASDAMMLPSGWDDAIPPETPYNKIPNTHPRLSGTRGTCFRLSRENDIPIMQAISAASYNPAKYLGAMGLKAMQERGRIQEGMVADITILDPKNVRDNSDYAEGTKPTTGIPYVIVNGTVVVRDSVVLDGVTPGQPIRFPQENKGRFKPLSLEEWRNTYLPATIDFGALDRNQLKPSAKEAPEAPE
ncbi:amidohydrolase family protein [Microbulbifer agarilyticus]|uniref:amidohydrolase family protein n=1 Tax=Microbulbifer agarilyticus TaxID=260552 RepID=UPI001CD707D6|nr:amidohydrolase family protein [Microbulbifer agarilyticus]MCA0899189.1 amidohydrolase family protein [Microbulbifer agarilyticus]